MTSGSFNIAESFNPCFNGTMYKNKMSRTLVKDQNAVSILVLMELCIKTYPRYDFENEAGSFNPCFNGTMYKNETS